VTEYEEWGAAVVASAVVEVVVHAITVDIYGHTKRLHETNLLIFVLSLL
jgi:hypothetical protein